MKKLVVLSLLMTLVLSTSCKKDDDNNIKLTEAKVKQTLQVDLATKQAEAIIKNAFDTQNGKTTISKAVLTDCVKTELSIEGLNTHLSLDYGNGCELPNGQIVSGIIKLDYSFSLENLKTSIAYTYEHFVTYGVEFDGGGTYDFTLSNDNENPVSILNFDYSLTLENGEKFDRKGQIKAEWSKGFDTLAWDDNVIETSGNWDTTFLNGETYHSNIATTLQSIGCLYFVSGVININCNGNEGILNFGNGDCDSIVEYTNSNGDIITIDLSKLWQ